MKYARFDDRNPERDHERVKTRSRPLIFDNPGWFCPVAESRKNLTFSVTRCYSQRRIDDLSERIEYSACVVPVRASRSVRIVLN